MQTKHVLKPGVVMDIRLKFQVRTLFVTSKKWNVFRRHCGCRLQI